MGNIFSDSKGIIDMIGIFVIGYIQFEIYMSIHESMKKRKEKKQAK